MLFPLPFVEKCGLCELLESEPVSFKSLECLTDVFQGRVVKVVF
jgi:hypothetical protein